MATGSGWAPKNPRVIEAVALLEKKLRALNRPITFVDVTALYGGTEALARKILSTWEQEGRIKRVGLRRVEPYKRAITEYQFTDRLQKEIETIEKLTNRD